MNRFFLLLALISWSPAGIAQDEPARGAAAVAPFAAYELGEAAFNEFQSYSGEVGLKFRNGQMVRLVHMNVGLTEKHLSSSFAAAVDGPDVEGDFFGFEAFYDFPVLLKGLYVAPSVGYYRSSYNHTVLDESYESRSPTVGVGVSYRETDLFGLNGLYYTVSVPMRISMNSGDDVELGDTIIRNGAFDNNVWLFVGFEF